MSDYPGPLPPPDDPTDYDDLSDDAPGGTGPNGEPTEA